MPDSHLQPSDLATSFSWMRLSALAKVAFDTRRWVAENATPERGDTLTGIGFRAWEHTKHAFSRAAAGDHSQWLSIMQDSAEFIMQVGMMPIRFCRGDSEVPLPENYAMASLRELEQIELALTAESRPLLSCFFRLLIQSDKLGFPIAIYLAQANLDGAIMMTWRIPLPDEGSGNGTAQLITPKKPVPLPELEVFTLKEIAERELEAAKAAEEERKLREQDRGGQSKKGA